jgi:methylphosphotriester-DNA--protein-cysteine methyltransferase
MNALLDMACRALKITPNHLSTISLRARILESKGDHVRELRDRRRIVELEPKNADRRKRLIIALRSVKQYKEAIRECDTLVEITGGKAASKLVPLLLWFFLIVRSMRVFCAAS